MRRSSLLATPRRLATLTAAVTLCAGLAAPTLPGVAAHAAALSPAASFVTDINAARASHGLRALKVAPDLTAVASRWAVTMAGHRTLSHNPRLGTAILHWRALAENVGTGQSVPQIHAAFMGSAPHRANILDSAYTEVGVGAVIVQGQVYVVEDFRLPG